MTLSAPNEQHKLQCCMKLLIM